MEIFTIEDLEYMCKYQRDFMSIEYKDICKKFLNDRSITDELLKLYVIGELEAWGDVSDSFEEFLYEDGTIIIANLLNGNPNILSIRRKN
jgi:hypothetical protein